MPQNKYLYISEIDKIIKFSKEGKNPYQISKLISRSPVTIAKYLKSPSEYGKGILRSGRKPKLCERDKRQVVKDIGFKNMSLREAARVSTTGVSHVTIWRCIASSNLKYEKMLRAPTLTKCHKVMRLKFAKETILKGERFWTKIVFSDEKRFCLEGPDHCRYYWHDIRTEKLVYPKNAFSTGIMVWAAISNNGFKAMDFINGTINALKYQNILRENLVQHWDSSEMIFQQDNATAHKAKTTLKWFQDHSIEHIDWPAKSPDLNIIENVWGILSNRIYKENRVYSTNQDLSKAIEREWTNISQNDIKNLFKSFPERLIDVISKKGGFLNK